MGQILCFFDRLPEICALIGDGHSNLRFLLLQKFALQNPTHDFCSVENLRVDCVKSQYLNPKNCRKNSAISRKNQQFPVKLSNFLKLGGVPIGMPPSFSEYYVRHNIVFLFDCGTAASGDFCFQMVFNGISGTHKPAIPQNSATFHVFGGHILQKQKFVRLALSGSQNCNSCDLH